MKQASVLLGKMPLREKGREPGEAGGSVRLGCKFPLKYEREGRFGGGVWRYISLRKVRQGGQGVLESKLTSKGVSCLLEMGLP